jgi:hypothetical protein
MIASGPSSSRTSAIASCMEGAVKLRRRMGRSPRAL